MRDSTRIVTSRPPSGPSTARSSLPPDIVRLVDVLARIELRRQLRLRERLIVGVR